MIDKTGANIITLGDIWSQFSNKKIGGGCGWELLLETGDYLE